MSTNFWEELGVTAAKAAVAALAGGLVAKAMNADWSFASIFGSDDKKPSVTPVTAHAIRSMSLTGHIEPSEAVQEALNRGFDSDAGELRLAVQELGTDAGVTIRFEEQGSDTLANIFVNGEYQRSVIMES